MYVNKSLESMLFWVFRSQDVARYGRDTASRPMTDVWFCENEKVILGQGD